MKKFNFLSILISIVCVYSSIATTAYANEDPYYKNNPGCVIDRGNPERTGVYNEKISDHPKIMWETDAASLHTPICAGNLIITNPLMAFDSMTGKKVWDASANTGDHNHEPIYYNGTIFWDKMFSKEKERKKSVNLMEYDAKTGKLFYQKSFASNSAVGLFIYNNIAYISLYGNGLTAYDLKTNKILWKGDAISDLEGISTDGETLFFTISNGGVYAMDIRNGKLLWNDNTFFEIGYVTVGKENVYVRFQPFMDFKEGIIAYNKKTGKIIWQRYFDNVSGFHKNGYFSSLTLHKDKLFFSNIKLEAPFIPHTESGRYSPAGGGVCALDAQTGKLIWYRNIAPFTAPISINNTLYIGGQNILYALNEDTGKERWHLNVKDDVINMMPYQNKLLLKLGMMKNEKLLAIF